MLVLSRKRNESIVIGEGDSKVVITVVEVRGDKVRLGIEANRGVPVHREEVFNVICAEKEKKDGTENLSSLSKENSA